MKKLLFIGLLFLSPLLFAQSAVQPLPPNKAFVFSTSVQDSQIIAHWQMPPGYYLYRERFKFAVANPQQTQLGQPVLPPGIKKSDKILGDYQVYKDAVDIAIPIVSTPTKKINLIVTYQGCSESGFCYPPTTKKVTVDLTSATSTITSSSATGPIHSITSQQTRATQLLLHHNLLAIFFGFLGFGLLLAFTPCILPMIPILSGIILGHGHHISTGKAFRLSLVYVLSMSVTYAVAGILVGYLGGSLQTIFQKPVFIILFSLIFVLMALSLFDVFHMHLSKKFEHHINRITAQQKKGSYVGVALMGSLATLIVSPCVTPPLIGALTYIGQSGDAFLGGIALFATGLGMGVPLLFIGTSGRKFLPKAGPWMNVMKYTLGVLLLAMAILMMSRILPGPVTLALWGVLLIGSAIFMGALTNSTKTYWSKVWRVLGIAILIYGVTLIIGAALGNSDPFKPFSKPAATENLPFHRVETLQDLTKALAFAETQNKPVLLDFYADWCLSCKIMDRETFPNPEVKAALANFILLRADVTANDANDKAIMQQYNVIAPPTILFFTPDGKELQNLRISGEISPAKLLEYLQQIHNSY